MTTAPSLTMIRFDLLHNFQVIKMTPKIAEQIPDTKLTPPDLNKAIPVWGAATRAAANIECSKPNKVPLADGPTRAVDSPVIVVDRTY